jgi:hypothetical protein
VISIIQRILMPAFLARLLNFTAFGSVSMFAKSVELRAKVPEWNL